MVNFEKKFHEDFSLKIHWLLNGISGNGRKTFPWQWSCNILKTNALNDNYR